MLYDDRYGRVGARPLCLEKGRSKKCNEPKRTNKLLETIRVRLMLFEINWSPPDRQVKQFAFLCFLLFPVVAWWWSLPALWIGVFFCVGTTFALLGFFAPWFLRPMFVGLSLIAAPFGMVVSELLLLLIFFGLFLPIAIVFRWLQRDALQRKVEIDRQSYWSDKNQPTSIDSYYKRY